MPERGRCVTVPDGPSPPAGPIPSSGWSARRSIRSSARWTVERWTWSRSASSPSVASGVSRRASATRRTICGWTASRPSASSSSIAASCRPAAPTARWRFADSALRTRFRSPRSARATWRASSSSSAPPAPIRRRNSPTVSAFFQVTTPRPRRSRHAAGSSSRSRRAARSGASAAGTTNSRWVRPPARLSEPRARNRPRRYAIRQCSAATSQSNGSGELDPVAERRRAAPLPQPDRQPRDGPLARRPARRQPRRLGPPVARPRRVDRGELGAQGRDEVALRPGHARVTTRRRPGSGRSGDVRAAPAAALAVVELQERRGEPGGIVVVAVLGIDDVLEREPRRRDRRGRPAQPDRLGAVARPARAPRTGCCARTDVDDARSRRGRRAPRRGRRGRSRSSRPAGSRRCRRRRGAPATPRRASRISGRSRLGSRLV